MKRLSNYLNFHNVKMFSTLEINNAYLFSDRTSTGLNIGMEI